MKKKKIAISLGDINGVGLQLALLNHKKILKYCDPIYCINKDILTKGAKLLNIKIPNNFKLYGKYDNIKINPGKISKKAGKFSYDSFLNAINLAKNKKVDSIVTLPINKKAWEKAGINYVGHTDMLRDVFKQNAIMMLGCQDMYIALFTEHIPLKKVAVSLTTKKLIKFLISFVDAVGLQKDSMAILGLNPHAGDDGVLGNEETKIKKAIKKVTNKTKQKFDLLVPDIAFTPHIRKRYKYFIAMYHDQGLAPLKALYFDKSINVSLNLPILRTSVDHGTAFDIAYKKNNNISSVSYLNAVYYL